MNIPLAQLSRPAWALLTLAAVLASTTVIAADKTGASDAQARYQQERAVCLAGTSNQDRATCLREAGAALAAAQRAGPDAESDATYERNARKRCERLPDSERRDCMARMDGQGTTSGSAAAGGIYRELVTRETVVPAPTSAGTEAPGAPVK